MGQIFNENAKLQDSLGVGGGQLRTKIAIFGDSFAWYENSNAYGNGAMDGSLWHKALGLIGYHRVEPQYFGVAGNRASDMKERIGTVLVSDASLVVGNCGANDFYGYGRTAEDVLADVSSMIESLISAGKVVVWANSPTQAITRSLWTLDKQKECLKYNRLLSAWAASKQNLYVVDLARAITDGADTTNAAPLTNTMATDGIHLARQGALLFGRIAKPTLDKIIPFSTRHFDPLDGFGAAASNNVMSVGRGQMSGTGGTAGTAITAGGNGIPASWTVKRGTGTIATGVANKVTKDNEGTWLELVMTAATNITTAEQFEINCASFHANLAGLVGKKARLVIEVEADSQSTLQITNLNPRFYQYDGVAIKGSDWSRNAGGNLPCIYMNDAFIVESPWTEIKSGLTAAQVYFYASVVGQGSAVVRIRNVEVQVTD